MKMGPLYPCGKPFSTGTHDNAIVKKLTQFFALINRIVKESRLRISNHIRMLSVLQSNQNSVIFCHLVTCKSHNLIGTLGSSEFGPK